MDKTTVTDDCKKRQKKMLPCFNSLHGFMDIYSSTNGDVIFTDGGAGKKPFTGNGCW